MNGASDERIILIYKEISKHLEDSLNGYNSDSSQYFFGRLCSSEELYKKIERIIFQE